MNIKEGMLSIVIHAFLGYLWVLFINHTLSIANSMNHMILSSLFLFVGTLLFGFIANRIAPFHNYKLTHPAKIVGAVSFMTIVLIQVLVYNAI